MMGGMVNWNAEREPISGLYKVSIEMGVHREVTPDILCLTHAVLLVVDELREMNEYLRTIDQSVSRL